VSLASGSGFSTPIMAGVHTLVSGLAVMLLSCLEACSGVFLIIVFLFFFHDFVRPFFP
jgi:hypothetical protein